MVNFIRFLFLSLLFIVWNPTSASEIEDDPLAKRCLALFEIYKKNDLSSFLNEFPSQVVTIVGEDTLKKQLNKKHSKFKEDYNSSPKEILITGIENIQSHPKAVERIGVEESKEVSIYIEGVNISRVDGCKFDRIKTKWYFSDTPL